MKLATFLYMFMLPHTDRMYNIYANHIYDLNCIILCYYLTLRQILIFVFVCSLITNTCCVITHMLFSHKQQ